MRQQAQLDLGVVRIHQHTALRRREHPPQLAAQLGACGDILQIRLRGAEPPGGGDGHLEAGAYPAVHIDDLHQPIHIGTLQLGVLAEAQYVVHDGIGVTQLFQHIGVGGPAGLCLFAVGQLQFLEQDIPQLLGGVDVESLSGGIVDSLLHAVRGLLQGRAEIRQGVPVHQETSCLHIRQHPAQRQLHTIVQFLHLQLPQLGRERPVQGGHGGGVADKRRLGGDVLPSQGIEGIRRQMVGLGQLLVIVGDKQPLQIVAAGGGVYQIGGQRRVEDETIGGQSLGQQGTHHVLDIVANLPDIRRKQGGQQRPPITGISVDINFNHQRAVCPGLAFHRQRRQIRCTVYGHVCRLAPQGQARLGTLGRLQYFRLRGICGQLLCHTGRGELVFIDEFLEFQLQKQAVQLRLEGLAQIGLRVEIQRRICVDGGQPVAVAGRGLAFLEFT